MDIFFLVGIFHFQTKWFLNYVNQQQTNLEKKYSELFYGRKQLTKILPKKNDASPKWGVFATFGVQRSQTTKCPLSIILLVCLRSFFFLLLLLYLAGMATIIFLVLKCRQKNSNEN